MKDAPIVLVIEDDETTLSIVVKALDLSGFRTRQARTAMEAVAAVKKERPDLILADVGLPDMDGATVTSLLHDEPEFASVPVILISAMEPAELESRMGESGAVDVLPKPFTSGELIRRVRHWVTASGSEGPPA